MQRVNIQTRTGGAALLVLWFAVTGSILWPASMLISAVPALAQNTNQVDHMAGNAPEKKNDNPGPLPYQETTDEYNQRLVELGRNLSQPQSRPAASDYRIGPDDQLEVTVLEAAELNGAPRVSASGEISLSLIGTVHAEGLTPQELEVVLQELLRRTYIKNPHVSVQVRDMQSHPIAVFGAVKKPGVFQVREAKTVIELLSMAEGLDVDAGDSVIVERSGAMALPKVEFTGRADSGAASEPAAASSAGATANANLVEIDLKKLLETGDPTLNVLVEPGDVVKVPRAGLVYVVGQVKKPGGYELKSNENISVLQAVAFAEGLTSTSSSSYARIIRTSEITGQRQEIPIDLNKILAGKKADPMLKPRDIVFVPNSAARSALYRGMEAAVSIGTGLAIYRP
jgi:polysaccharide biosynthesis/export protein